MKCIQPHQLHHINKFNKNLHQFSVKYIALVVTSRVPLTTTWQMPFVFHSLWFPLGQQMQVIFWHCPTPPSPASASLPSYPALHSQMPRGSLKSFVSHTVIPASFFHSLAIPFLWSSKLSWNNTHIIEGKHFIPIRGSAEQCTHMCPIT